MSITALQNFYESTLSAGISSSDLVIPITNAPTPTEGWLLLDYDIPAKREFVYYTSGNSTSVTVPSTGGRGQDNTAAIPHSQNAKVRMNVNGGLLMNVINAAATSVNQNNNGGWVPLTTVPTVTASNGQKEYVLTYSGANYTDRLQKGSKLMIPRTVVPPTQSMSFTAASSQYASKASPTGITFTTAFTTEAWVYMTSYPTSTVFAIDRFDNAGTNGGWFMAINSSGQVISGYGTGSTFTQNVSYQSVPLNAWVHIAGVVSSVSSKTITIYINGVVASSNQSLAAATALSQPAVDLRVGAASANATSTYFNGYISEARVWSVGQTQTQINNNMGISLAGSETNLVALFQGNGNFNDKTSNANNLTASGGAVATQPANPYNTTEYAIATNVAYIAGNTTVTVFSGQNVIPNATLGATSYSGQRAPFGFPADRNMWSVIFIDKTSHNAAALTNSTYFNPDNLTVTIPTGRWVINESILQYGQKGAAGSQTVTFNLGTAPTTNQINESILSFYYNSSSSLDAMQHASKQFYYTSGAVAPLYIQLWSNSGASAVSNAIRGDFAPTMITAECAYL